MPTTLCFDFGNTRLKYAVFAGDDLRATGVLTDDTPGTLTTLLDNIHPDYIMLSSVIDGNAEGEKLLEDQPGFHRLNHLSRLPFSTPVGKPETIGADRLALVAAAVHFFSRSPAPGDRSGLCRYVQLCQQQAGVYRWKYFSGNGNEVSCARAFYS